MSKSSAYGFCCRKIFGNDYEISWIMDFKYPNSRLRYPRRFARITDKKGAIRFCKKHKIPM